MTTIIFKRANGSVWGFGVMVLISRKVDYGILALHQLMVAEGGVSARELADRFGLSRPFIANILKELCHEGLIESQRGVHGGYRLARPAAEIRMDQVIAALDGPFQLMSCAPIPEVYREHVHGVDEPCGLMQRCPVRGPLLALHEKLVAALGELTLEDLRNSEGTFVALNTESQVHDLVANLS